MIKIDRSIIENAIEKTSTMGGASILLKLDRRTFKRIALEYELYNPKKGVYNQYAGRFDTEDILDGKHPQYPTSKLSKRLIKEGYKEYKCEKPGCGISEWNGESISLELNHKDGNNGNHKLENLELLCPNCHSQTPTYRSKKLIIGGGPAGRGAALEKQ